MQTSTRRRPPTRNGVVAGSVWESRMRMDAVNGGIKVFTGNESRDDDESNAADEEGMKVYRRLRRHRSDSIAAASRTRKSWAPPNPAENVLIGKNPIGLRKTRSEESNSPELGKKKRVLLIGDGREDGGEDENVDEEEIEIGVEEERESFDDKEMDQRMEKPDIEEEDVSIPQIHEVPLLPLNAEKKQNPVIVSPSKPEKKHNSLMPIVEKKQNPVTSPSPTAEKKKISVVSPPPIVEKKQNPSTPPLPKKNSVAFPSAVVEKKQNPATTPTAIVENKNDPVIATSPVVEKKQSSVILHRALDPDPAEIPFEVADEMLPRMSVGHSRLQSIVDLIMWRDVSKTAFVFGLGTFFLISSSYAKDLNFSLIAAASYAGLVYLAMIFVYKSILNRGEMMDYDESDERYMLGEEEAIWLLRMLLPYINEILSKLRSLFSGDPATTMKLAVLLFVMARCGSSITLWSLAKMTFLGIFTIPKVCSSYSTQLAKHGKFWLERFRDGWESCAHKKAAAAVIFTLIWNISSTVARVWAVFMLVVAMKLYQQNAGQDWVGQEEVEVVEERREDSMVGQRPGLGVLHRHRGGGPSSRKVVVRERGRS